jgi:site-specific recombinase XerD
MLPQTAGHTAGNGAGEDGASEFAGYARWLARRFPSSETCWHYPNDLKLIRAWLDKPIVQMTMRDVDDYIEHALGVGHKPNTVKRRLAALTSYFTFLDLMLPDPPRCPVLPKRHTIKQPQRLPRDVDDATVMRFFAVIRRVRDRAMFALMYVCGLRLGEVRNLRLSGLHLEPTTPGALPRITFVGKGNKERSVPVASFALVPLKLWLRQRPPGEDDAVFLTRDGRRYNPVNIRRLLDRYCQTAGVKFTCHQLRHAFARLLAERGVNAPAIQHLLGHKYLETTQVYLHVSDPVLMASYDAAMQQVGEAVPLIGGIGITSIMGVAGTRGGR